MLFDHIHHKCKEAVKDFVGTKFTRHTKRHTKRHHLLVKSQRSFRVTDGHSERHRAPQTVLNITLVPPPQGSALFGCPAQVPAAVVPPSEGQAPNRLTLQRKGGKGSEWRCFPWEGLEYAFLLILGPNRTGLEATGREGRATCGVGTEGTRPRQSSAF